MKTEEFLTARIDQSANKNSKKNDLEQAFNRAEILFGISELDEINFKKNKKYPEELITRAFRNSREMLKHSLSIMIIEGVIDNKKFSEKYKTIIPMEKDFEEHDKQFNLLKIDHSIRKFWSVHEALSELKKEVEENKKFGFLEISIDERNIGAIVKSGVYKGSNHEFRHEVEEALGSYDSQKDKVVTYAGFIDERYLEKAKTHGQIIFKLNSSVMKDRTVFVVGDSLVMPRGFNFLEKQTKDLGQIDSALKRQILPEHVALCRALLNLSINQLNFGSNEESSILYDERPYIEGQIIGSIDLSFDVEEVILDETVFNDMYSEDKESFKEKFGDKIRLTNSKK